jgi:hypothetical protein
LDSCAAALPSVEKVDNIGGVSQLKKIVTGSFMSFREKWSRVLLHPSSTKQLSDFVFWKLTRRNHHNYHHETESRYGSYYYCRPFLIMFSAAVVVVVVVAAHFCSSMTTCLIRTKRRNKSGAYKLHQIHYIRILCSAKTATATIFNTTAKERCIRDA